MDLEREDSGEDEEEEDKIELPPFVRPQVHPLSGPTPSDVVVEILGELAPKEGVGYSTLGTESATFEARSFAFEPNKEAELPIILHSNKLRH